jgi:HEAT repeat protein
MSHQGEMRAGVDDMATRAAKETPFKIIKDVRLGLKDADPNVRVAELNKLRYLKDAEVNDILLQCMSDPDLRVKVKAIDLLGAREANVAVPAMNSMLFLRSTEPIVKLHLVAALGRIGDAQAALPVIQYLSVEQDDRGRGTAVFALGEIGSEQSAPVLNKVIEQDNSPMVRRLAKEALQKISGEMPTEHKKEVATQTNLIVEPTDQKLAKLRELDKKLEEMER